MKKVIILGAGFAGMHLFYKLRDLIGEKITLTVVEPSSYSLLKPSLPEVALDGASVEHVHIPIRHAIETRGAALIHARVVEIDPNAREILCDNGEKLVYDTLFIALGAVKDYDAIEGFREYGYSVCDDTQAQRLWERLQSFEGGHVVTGSAKSEFGTLVEAPKLSAPCEGPIGEVMFMLDHFLKERKHLSPEAYSITAFSPAAEFFEDVGPKPHEVVAKYMQAAHIGLETGKVLKRIEADHVAFEDGTRMPCDLPIIIPPYTAPEVIAQSGLGDDRGFVPTDKTMRHLNYPDIYAAGDATALAQPKLGHIAIIQAGIAAAAFRKELGESVEIPPFAPNVFCIMNMGGAEAILINDDTLYGGTTSVAFHSPISKMMKWGFDNYLYYNRGHMPPDWALTLTDKLTEIL